MKDLMLAVECVRTEIRGVMEDAGKLSSRLAGARALMEDVRVLKERLRNQGRSEEVEVVDSGDVIEEVWRELAHLKDLVMDGFQIEMKLGDMIQRHQEMVREKVEAAEKEEAAAKVEMEGAMQLEAEGKAEALRLAKAEAENE